MNTMHDVWSIVQCEGSESVRALLELLMPEYIRIFGKDTMLYEPCIVYNEKQSSCPMLVTNTNPIRIRLSQLSLSYWAQTVFQLSHEMCHYAIRQKKSDKDYSLTWFEEVLCESMSLYALEYAAANWSRCDLSQMSPRFGVCIQDYLINELKDIGTDELYNSTSLIKLKAYNEICCDDRGSHRNERNIVYKAIHKNPLDARCFLNYPQYINPSTKLTIDFDRWEQDDPCYLVRILRYTQPNISFSKELINV